jgi:hypothetical protein
VDVLERLTAAFVRLGVRTVAAGAVHESAAPRAGYLRFACRTITGQAVTIAALERHPITDRGGERPVSGNPGGVGWPIGRDAAPTGGRGLGTLLAPLLSLRKKESKLAHLCDVPIVTMVLGCPAKRTEGHP